MTLGDRPAHPAPSRRPRLVRATPTPPRWNARYEELAEQPAGLGRLLRRQLLGPARGAARDRRLRHRPALDRGPRARLPPRRAPAARRATCPTPAASTTTRSRGARLLADEERFGAFCAGFVERQPGRAAAADRLVQRPDPARGRPAAGADGPARAAALAARPLGRLIPGAGRKQVWFGFVSRYAFWRGVRAAMSRRAMAADHPRRAGADVPRLQRRARSATATSSRAARFARQMRLLRALRYRVLGFAELARTLRDGEPLPRARGGDHDRRRLPRQLRDRLADAPPPPRSRRPSSWSASASAASNDWDRDGAVAGRPLLALEQIERMRADGIPFGAHTRTHPLPDREPGERSWPRRSAARATTSASCSARRVADLRLPLRPLRPRRRRGHPRGRLQPPPARSRAAPPASATTRCASPASRSAAPTPRCPSCASSGSAGCSVGG